MTQNISQILTSLLDTDAYKFYMQQAVFHNYFNLIVTAEFFCRNNELLGIYSECIMQQIVFMSTLSLSDEEYNYLNSLSFFKKDYLNWLRNFRFNLKHINCYNQDGNLNIRITGPWCEVMMWEVPLLAVISEVVHQYRSPLITPAIAVSHLYQKILAFNELSADIDLTSFKLIDFGTRRRFSYKIQHAIIKVLKTDFLQFIGTSNYKLARELNLTPIGTQAHEWFQAHQQICPILANSQRHALQTWLVEYPDQLGIALTDCITMDAFLQDFSAYFANIYKGLRHDSGEPFEWGEKAIYHYQKLGINPMTKVLVFSDNLDLSKSLELYRHFHNRINLAFGIGTSLTCDIPDVKPLNIVIKLVTCNGQPVAKLSDSPGKSICYDKNFLKTLRKAFNLPLINKDNLPFLAY
ncbi:nicotinate phosphoribosyltransferase [Candidatus Profftia sp. (ex Adelges kitamiensis)]|uniref:nicotinate phosphoribosyltransferase n=1 Tax=Candidatus Profftia sp. (ex Adelges kitamiensis) TaxID=2864218 RepID=UPI001CE32141|nr:nicotinate phosphoribosyltransferase [Candidatus Profftia sp. (ex Adelges kitamiensis)]